MSDFEEFTSPQEKLMLRMQLGQVTALAESWATTAQITSAVSLLSVIRPNILLDFASIYTAKSSTLMDVGPIETYKLTAFENHLPLAEVGNPEAISSLPKFVETPAQLAVAMELALNYAEEVTEWRTNQTYLQFLATFDPQHIGHRIAIQSALAATKPSTQVIVHIMGNHPSKTEVSSPYEDRYKLSEQKLYTSPYIHAARVTQIDLPGGIGLGALDNTAQMELLAASTGDDRLRWLIGSDKLLLDASRIRRGENAIKSIARFFHPKLETYVVRRTSDIQDDIENAADYVQDSFKTPITLIDEMPYDCAPASSTRIKDLLFQGKIAEAAHMEWYEVPREGYDHF